MSCLKHPQLPFGVPAQLPCYVADGGLMNMRSPTKSNLGEVFEALGGEAHEVVATHAQVHGNAIANSCASNRAQLWKVRTACAFQVTIAESDAGGIVAHSIRLQASKTPCLPATPTQMGTRAMQPLHLRSQRNPPK